MTRLALAGETIPADAAMRILTDPNLELLPLMHAAYQVRARYFGRYVRVQILNNVQNGYCPEDCNYCAQAAGSEAKITKFHLKPDEEILVGAKKTWEAGAFRYCIVLSGRGPTENRVDHMAGLVRQIKAQWPVEVCLSAGFIDEKMAKTLKEAGLDRYNHNLNTAENHYGAICTSHGYADRLHTLENARKVGLEVCSGIIIGMGETPAEVLEVAMTLRRLQARSIPVNFYVHIEGARLGVINALTPQYCLRVLALFRLTNPDAEIRAAGGRESNLRSLETLALYPANAVFSEGYLNTGGDTTKKTVSLIEDAGFVVERIEEKDDRC
ncbi:MAG: biotin synthase BioB [Magnetococcales bacterium]|nr:biotin synthase BioB [Magnetococcales bacterium]MBF0322335.1 biotin synthase BioB [Magnetococcales bacterium]